MKKITQNAMEYRAFYSNEVDEDTISDFIHVHTNVFGNESMNVNVFKRKYIHNIYGNSIIVVVYENNNAIAARAFWRNDINHKKAYQPADTCVKKEYRGKGIFIEMTKIALEMIDQNDIIYNFPNKESYRQYIKLGWKDIACLYPKLYLSYKEFMREHQYVIDDDYLQWWVIPKEDSVFKYKKIRNERYLLLKEIKKMNISMYKVIGEVNREMTKHFERAKNSKLKIYYASKKNLYSNIFAPYKVLGFNVTNINIPLFKIDAL